MASDETVGRNRKPNRKAPKQISFRVSESEYLKLRLSVTKDLSMLGTSANQIAKYCNQHQHETPNFEALERNISELRERLDEIWNKLN